MVSTNHFMNGEVEVADNGQDEVGWVHPAPAGPDHLLEQYENRIRRRWSTEPQNLSLEIRLRNLNALLDTVNLPDNSSERLFRRSRVQYDQDNENDITYNTRQVFDYINNGFRIFSHDYIREEVPTVRREIRKYVLFIYF